MRITILPRRLARTLGAVGAVGAVLVLALAGCSTASTDSSAGAAPAATTSAPAATSAPAMTDATRTGTFEGRNDKTVSGTAEVGSDEVVLSGFSSDEGPDLHIYLTNGDQESDIASGKELGRIDFSAASQTFTLSGVDASGYTTVVIHCDKAKAVFGAATLS